MQIYDDDDDDDDNVHLMIVVLGNNVNIIWLRMLTWMM